MSSRAVQAGKTKSAAKSGSRDSAQKKGVASAKSAAAGKTSTRVKTVRTHKPVVPVPAIAPAELSHRIHALLHTIHQIERYEERLCSMQDAIKRTGKLNAPLLRDLRELLDEIPAVEYQHDLDALRDAVPA